MNKLLLNALLFQLGWFLCVFAAQQPWLLLGVPLLLAIHLGWVAGWHAEDRLLVSVLLSGAALDSTLLQMGVLDFAGDSLLLPLWLAALWLLFGTTLNHCLAWSARPWWRASLLGACGGPLSYYAGAQLAGVGMPLGLWPSLLILAGCWAVLLPLLHGFASLQRQRLASQ